MKQGLTALLLIVSLGLSAQNLIYSPGSVFEKTVDLNYYSTDYIFIRNNTPNSLSLNFELIEDNTPIGWAKSGCTNLICYVKVPEYGTLGILNPGDEAYLSINLAVNETSGTGSLKFVLSSPENPSLADTIRFVYHASENLNSAPQPWASLHITSKAVTAFVSQPGIETTFYCYNLHGQLLHQKQLGEIYTYPTQDLMPGSYIIVILDENGRKLVKKINAGF